MRPRSKQLIELTRSWLETFVVGMDLCPFARRELDSGRVHFEVSAADSEEQLLEDLLGEFSRLDADKAIETTLLIHPGVLRSFTEYNQFLGLAEELLIASGREGIYQIASFHPDYQFAGTAPEDAENYSNRSPCPMLHLLREESLEKAIASHPDPEGIPQRNIELMNSLGADHLEVLLQACFTSIDDSPQNE
jgi:hypothetical protein